MASVSGTRGSAPHPGVFLPRKRGADLHTMDDRATVAVGHGSYHFTLATGSKEEAAALAAALEEYLGH